MAASTKPSTINLLVVPKSELVDEGAPHTGFADAQPIDFGRIVRGVIANNNEVDVYRFSAKAGQKITAEINARRRHSVLDSLLCLYDHRGNLIAENDDAEGLGSDSRIELTIKHPGVYYLTVNDASNRGGPQFPYLLTLK